MNDTRTKKLIMPINIQDDHFDGFDFGIIEMTQFEMYRIRTMSELVKTAKATIHDGAYKFVAWDGGIETMKTDYDAETLEDGRLPFLAHTDEYEGRIECVCLNVTDSEFFWTFYPKHTDIRCETKNYPISVLDTFDTIDDRDVTHEQ
jgi:hypothetical protein